MFFKKKEMIKEELDRFDKRFAVKTKEGEFRLFLCGKDIFCKGVTSKDHRYGRAFLKDLEIGETLYYHSPRLDRKVNLGRIKSIST